MLSAIMEFYTKLIWSRRDIDALVLAPPLHDGTPKSVAREVYHRLLVRLLAVRIHRFQWLVLGGALVVGACLHAASALIAQAYRVFGPPGGSSDVSGLVGFTALALLPITAVLLPLAYIRTIAPTDEKEEALGIVQRVFLRTVTLGTPSDLADPYRQGWLTSGMTPTSAEISEADARSMDARGRAAWWLVTAYLVTGSLAGAAWAVSTWWLGLVLCAAVRWWWDKSPAEIRARELEAAQGVEGAAYVAAGGLAWAQIGERARAMQVASATEDRTARFALGEATGVLAARGDFHAPSAGLPFRLTLKDLQTQTLVLGGTGSGKTSGILRPMARQAFAHKGIGVVVLDGKGALPAELHDPDVTRLIDPASTTLSLVAGLSPVDVVNTLRDVLVKPAQGGDRFWTDSAAGLLLRAAVIARAAGDKWWTLAKIGRIATQEAALAEVWATLTTAQTDADPMLADATGFFREEWPALDERTRSNIVAVVRAWLSTITSHPHLLAWAEAEGDGGNEPGIGEALRGGRVGVLIPAHRYGEGGAVVTALLKARLYAGLRARAEQEVLAKGETPVLLVIDEAQEVATKEDATMLAIGRSLGLSVVAATQTVEGVQEKLGVDVSRKWLSIFGNLIAFPGRSPETDTFVAARAGHVYTPAITEVEGMPVRAAVQMHAISGAIAASKTQLTVREALGAQDLGLPKLAQAVGVMLRRLGAASEAHKQPMSRLGPHPLLEPGEIPMLLAEPATALALVTRARVPWRDVIRVNPQHS